MRTLEPWTLAIWFNIFFSVHRMRARPFEKSIQCFLHWQNGINVTLYIIRRDYFLVVEKKMQTKNVKCSRFECPYWKRNLKIIVYYDRKTLKREKKIKKQGWLWYKDGDDWHGLQTRSFSRSWTVTSSFKEKPTKKEDRWTGLIVSLVVNPR